jgi:DNA-binding CsgD family transcriptional regulator/sugar-specific transcriptional regulator TrmB
LEAFDLSPAEETLYLALIDVPCLTIEEITPLLDTTEEGVRAVVRRLETTGLIARLPGTPHRYCAIEPGIGFASLLAAQQERIHQAEEQASRAHAVASQLAERFRLRDARHPVDLVEVVVGPDAVRQRAYQLQDAAKHGIRGIDIPPYVTEPAPELARLADGMTSRWVYDRGALDIPGKLDEIGKLTAAGQCARVINDAPMKLMIADDKFALIALTSAASGTVSALVVGPSIFFDGLAQMFETLWQYAVPLSPAKPEPGTDVLSAEESRLLALLAIGMTDEAIARRVGLGLRTVQKRVRHLMQQLNAGTRFQAGVRAKARGWL